MCTFQFDCLESLTNLKLLVILLVQLLPSVQRPRFTKVKIKRGKTFERGLELRIRVFVELRPKEGVEKCREESVVKNFSLSGVDFGEGVDVK